AGLPLPAAPPLKVRTRQLVLRERWSIQGLVEEGQTLRVRAAADDFDNVTPDKGPGRSTPVLELKVVSRQDLKPVVQEALRKVRDGVKRVHDMQEKALEKVRAAEQQLPAIAKVSEDIKKLKDDMGRLARQVQAAQQLKDEAERNKRLEKLAQEQKRL